MYLIYRHINKINGKSYIGQTSNLKKRIGNQGSGYLSKKKNGEYAQPAFAFAILKYGWDNFETEILKENLTLEEANFYEFYYIEEYESEVVTGKGYNIQKGGHNSPLSEKTKEKIRQYNLENGSFLTEHNPLEREVICLETGKIFKNCKEAEQSVDANAKNGNRVAEVCRGNSSQKKVNGFRFRYYEDIISYCIF